MNVRALALGAMVGFVVAIAPACSPPKCGPSNCDGCCDASGACVKKPDNGLNTTCGSAGNACTNCAESGATCNPATNTCGTGGTGGGTGGGSGGGSGGGNGCAGCRLSTGTCVPPASLTPNNCGKDGDRCQACAAGQTCNAGVCETPPPTVTIGSRCTMDSECQATLGPTSQCRKQTNAGSAYAGGYCTIPCGQVAGTCPAASTCVGGVEELGEGTFCWKNCTPPNTIGGSCGTGYACYGIGGNSGACWIYPTPPRDAGVPADKVGNPCTADGQCQNPPETGGACLSRDFNYNWQALGGYCSRTNCAANADCSADGGALCLGFTEEEAACVQRCADSSDGGQSTCRPGFVCEPYFITVDGGQRQSTDGYCVPPEAPAATSIGGPCANDAECSQPAGAIADCFPPALPDGGATPYTGGYCTRLDCESDEDCGVGADGGATNRCLFSQQGQQVFSFCYKGCSDSRAGNGECRQGYTCDGYGLADGGRSTDGYCNVACDAPGVGACPAGSTCVPATGYCTTPDGGIL